MKIIKKTGLVPVKDLLTGEVFGVSPDTARVEVNKGRYQLMEIPSDYETEEVEGPEILAGGAPVDDGDGEKETIQIPEDWRKDQHLKRIKLAKDLFPSYQPPDGKWTADIADAKIEEEIARRLSEEPQA